MSKDGLVGGNIIYNIDMRTSTPYLRKCLITKGGRTYIIHDAMMVLLNGFEVGAECYRFFTLSEMWFKVWGT